MLLWLSWQRTLAVGNRSRQDGGRWHPSLTVPVPTHSFKQTFRYNPWVLSPLPSLRRSSDLLTADTVVGRHVPCFRRHQRVPRMFSTFTVLWDRSRQTRTDLNVDKKPASCPLQTPWGARRHLTWAYFRNMPSSYFCKNSNLDLKNFKGKQARLDHKGKIFWEHYKSFSCWELKKK